MGKAKDNVRLEKRLFYWQEKLGLDDWDITIEYGDVSKGYWAWVEYNVYKRTADITMSSTKNFKTQLDATIIHELVHLVFAEADLFGKIRKYKSFCRFEEDMCDYVADVALAMKRGRK